MNALVIALAGNPNAGKTTMFNALTGARQHVANYPGVTVEKKEGQADFDGTRVTVVDLPGAYSLTAYTQEELVARRFLVDERPDVVVDVLNAGALERNLYLTIQFLEMGIPVVLALNMMDEVRKQGKEISARRLSELIRSPVVETVARSGEGKRELLAEALRYARERQGDWRPIEISYGPDLDPALGDMTRVILTEAFMTAKYPARWTALKYLEGDEDVIRQGAALGGPHSQLLEIAKRTAEHCRKTLDASPESLIADFRYGFIASLMKNGVLVRDVLRDRIDFSDQLDRVLTQPLLGPAIMIAVLYGIYSLTFTLGEFPMNLVQDFFSWLGGAVEGAMAEGLLRSLLVSGVIDGVGGVLGFVPLIMIMFLCISFLEDSGYMARMAYMLDRVFRIFGLHGCSIMPFIVSGGIAGGCAVPGIMATRALRSPKEKLATILTAPFMTCGAKLPVFLLLVGAFFPGDAATVMFGITLLGWALALIVARILRSTIIAGPATPFVMELPPYRLPTLRGMLIHTWERTWHYIQKAGTTILAISILCWAAMTFPQLHEDDLAPFEAKKAEVSAQIENARGEDKEKLEERLGQLENEQAQAALKHSLAGRMGVALESVTEVAGFDWRTNIALVGGFAAKEVIVATLGTAYSLGAVDAEESEGLAQALAEDASWSPLKAASLILFVLLYAPCMVTVATIGKEVGWKWASFAMVFNTLLAFGLSTALFQAGTALGF